MARRNGGSTATPDAPAPEAEATVPAQAEGDTPTPEGTDAAPAAVEVDLTEFSAKVAEAVEARDTSTGDVPVEQVGPVQAAYRALDGLKAKNAAKAHIAEAMKTAMNALDITSARAYMVLTESLASAGSGTKQEKAPADPKVAFTERYQSLLLALEVVGNEVPEGVTLDEITVSDEQRTQLQTLLAYNANEAEDKGDAPEVSPVVRSAVKVASGKASGGRKAGVGTGSNGGVRRDIAAHIQSAFAGVDAGTFLTVAEIRTHQSEEYGTESPSAGAISARLFPASGKSTVAGVEPGTNDKGVRGATKVAA